MKKLMLRLVLVLVLCTAGLGIIYMTNPQEGPRVRLGDSKQFSAQEVDQAARLVMDSFSFPGCTLTEVRYNEEASDRAADLYMAHGKGQSNGVERENVIVLFSDFDVDISGENPVFEPGSRAKDFNWILIREDSKSPWVIDDWGY